MKNLIWVAAISLFIGLPAWASADPDVQFSINAEKEIIEIVDGESITKRVKAQDVRPGNVLIYTINYSNQGDETATNVEFKDPIPQGTSYVEGSNFAPGSVTRFSIDGGDNFGSPDDLIVQSGGKDSVASASDYTHIRWTLSEIKPGKGGQVTFRVLVK